jgi:hypothetical protein
MKAEIDKFGPRLFLDVKDIIENQMPEYARTNHPYSDDLKTPTKFGYFRTGDLTRSIFGEAQLISDQHIHGRFGASMPYAAHVEYGIRRNVLTGRPNAPYPFIWPTMERFKDEIEKAIWRNGSSVFESH